MEAPDFVEWDASLRLEEAGLRLRRPVTLRRSLFIPYADITHLAVGSRGIWIGTRRGISVLRRAKFARRDGPEVLRNALLVRISRCPRGLEQLARFAEIDALGRRPFRRIAGSVVVLGCAAVFLLQLADPFAEEAGAFIPGLVRQGELWRVLTANFFHSASELPLHLGFNVIALLFLAVLVERPLGPVRCAVVMGAAALGAMGASALAGYAGVTGASGIVFGLVGAVLCMELHFPHRLPVWWRLPRLLVCVALAWEAVVAVFAPFIAGAAHAGGFVAGYAATRMLAAGALVRAPSPRWANAVAGAFALATLLSFAAAGPLLMGDREAMGRHGRNLLATSSVPSHHFNSLAWRLATEHDPTPSEAALAVALAERAVEYTDRTNPDWLDTLAEALFVAGDRGGALSVIEEAIGLAPGVEYFHEQRRRFLGEREFQDRPPPPRYPWPFYPVAPLIEEPRSGIEV